jgi:hypothetical protein
VGQSKTWPHLPIQYLPNHIKTSLSKMKYRKRGPDGAFITPNASPDTDDECDNVDEWKFYCDGPLHMVTLCLTMITVLTPLSWRMLMDCWCLLPVLYHVELLPPTIPP